MNRRLKNKSESSVNLGRLFGWTAVLAVVFSVGIILGQRLLIERSLPPMISTSEAAPNPLATTNQENPGTDEVRNDLFSFYDALTGGGAEDSLHNQNERFDAFDLDEDDADDGADPIDDPGEFAARGHDIDPDDAPNTDDGTLPARFTLQIASHPSLERARVEMDRIKSMGLEPHIVAADIPGQGQFYRIRIGKFPSEDEARAFQDRIENRHDVSTFLTPL